MYLRMPQGYLASGNAYTWWYDKIIKDKLCKVKIVDNTLLYDFNIFDSLLHYTRKWNHTWQGQIPILNVFPAEPSQSDIPVSGDKNNWVWINNPHNNIQGLQRQSNHLAGPYPFTVQEIDKNNTERVPKHTAWLHLRSVNIGK